MIDCIIEGYNYSREEVIDMLEKSIFLRDLQVKPDYILHYNLEDWAEKI